MSKDKNDMRNNDGSSLQSAALLGTALTAVAGAGLYVLHELGKSTRKGKDKLSHGVRFFQSKEKASQTAAENTAENITAGVGVCSSAVKEAVRATKELVEETKDSVRPR